MIFRCLLALVMLFLLCMPSLHAQQDNSSMPPAAMSELARNGVSLKTSVINPSAGVYAGVSDLIRQEQYARVLNNLQMTKKGVWTSRGIGYTTDSAQLGVGPVNGLHYNSSVPGEIFVHVIDKIYKYNVTSKTASADISGGLFSNCQSCIRSASTSTIVTHYNNLKEPAYSNAGATFVSTVWPITVASVSYTKPKYNEPFQTRVAFAGFAANPYSVLLTNANAINGCTQTVPQAATDGGIITFPSVLGKITGLRSYRYGTGNGDNVLIVGCERGFGMVTGTSALNYISMEITREFGLRSNESWQELDGELYFLATDGIRKMSVYSSSGDFRSTIVSQPVDALLARINAASAEIAFSVRHSSTKEIQFWIPIDSDTTCQNAIVFNYNTRNPELASDNPDFQPAFSTKNGLIVTRAIDMDGTMYGGTTDGYVTKHYDGDTYAGGAINWQYVSPLIGANSPAQNASLKKFVILTDGPAQKFTAQAFTLTTHADGTTRWVPQTSQVQNVATQTITTIDTWESGSVTSYPKFIEYAPMGSGRFWCLKLSGAATDEHISLVGLQAILNLGGWKQ